jgi:hypothetical protein
MVLQRKAMTFLVSYKTFLFPILLLAMTVNCVKGQGTSTPIKMLEYSILQGSRVTVVGSTNVNEFSCISNQAVGNKALRITNRSTQGISFENALIKLRSESLNCGNEVMNKKLFQTLQADKFESIIIELEEAKPVTVNFVSSSSGILISARVFITLAGKRRLNVIELKCEIINQNKYHFTGRHVLSLSEYGIIPPEAFFGLVKVNDSIIVQFDLFTEVSEAN